MYILKPFAKAPAAWLVFVGMGEDSFLTVWLGLA